MVTFKDLKIQQMTEEIANKDRQLSEMVSQRDESWKKIVSDVCIKEELASGSFGTVYKGILPVAVKKSKHPEDEFWSHNFKREIELMVSCRHPNIVPCLAAAAPQQSSPIILVMPLMDCSLHNFIEKENNQLQWLHVVRIALDVAKGLSYLHGKNILHRDIKSDNILLKNGNAKIGDLGSARYQQVQMSPYHGTRIYTAPEVLQNNTQTPKVSKHFSYFSSAFLFFSSFLSSFFTSVLFN